jgi:putative addiction module killer protein
VQTGPGYRVYFTRKGNAIVILLCGGDKKSQSKDIRLAQQMAKEV